MSDLVTFFKNKNVTLEETKTYFDLLCKNDPKIFDIRFEMNETFLYYFPFSNLEITQYVFEFLHYNYPKIFYRKDNRGNTFLFDYIYSDLSVTKFLFSFLRQEYSDIFEKKNNLGITFFHIIWRCDLESLKFMFDFFKDTHLFEIKDNKGNTFLHHHINFENENVVRFVIDFLKENFPNVLSEKNNESDSFLHCFLGCNGLKINLDTHLSNLNSDYFIRYFHDEEFLKKNYLDIKTFNSIRYKDVRRWNNKKVYLENKKLENKIKK